MIKVQRKERKWADNKKGKNRDRYWVIDRVHSVSRRCCSRVVAIHFGDPQSVGCSPYLLYLNVASSERARHVLSRTPRSMNDNVPVHFGTYLPWKLIVLNTERERSVWRAGQDSRRCVPLVSFRCSRRTSICFWASAKPKWSGIAGFSWISSAKGTSEIVVCNSSSSMAWWFSTMDFSEDSNRECKNRFATEEQPSSPSSSSSSWLWLVGEPRWIVGMIVWRLSSRSDASEFGGSVLCSMSALSVAFGISWELPACSWLLIESTNEAAR